MRIVCLSDTHNQHRDLVVPRGDVLIHAGDATGEGLSVEVKDFMDWFANQPHRTKILIAGNHDWFFQRNPAMARHYLDAHPGITYLQDSGIEVDGLKIWGSPWQPYYMNWAFNLLRNGSAIREAWGKIPLDTDILVTHGPPHGVMDTTANGDRVGCEELAIRLAEVKPLLHVFGHIHGGYGHVERDETTYINASNCTEDYEPINPPMVVRIKGRVRAKV